MARPETLTARLKSDLTTFATGDAESTRAFRLTDATRDPAINRAFADVLSEKNAVDLRVEIADLQGSSFHLSVAALGNELVVGVFFDITQLERLERVRREFFANLSHELRTPLTAMLACAETLLTGALEDPANRRRFVETLYKHATRMTELISDISDLSAIESGQIELTLKPVRLAPVVADVIALVESRKAEADITLNASVPDDVFVHADRRRLEQILYNLIDNAVKFNRPGGSVTVTSEGRNGSVAISVIDTGTGIEATDLPRVFERLYRGDKSRSRKAEGSGLGLAIVKHLVHAHGGEVSGESKPGGGARFTFTMPTAAPEEKADSGISAARSSR